MIGESPRASSAESADGMADLAGVARLAGRLLQSAARHLGLDPEASRRAARTATLASGDKTILILPMGRGEGASLSLVLCVQTSIPVERHTHAGLESAQAVEVLQHVPALLHAFSASIGVTAEGCWTVCRSVRMEPDEGAALATCVLETVELTDFVLRRHVACSH